MKKFFVLMIFSVISLYFYSCAPICKSYDTESFVNKNIPKAYIANGYFSFGPLDYPFTLQRINDKYILSTPVAGNVKFTQRGVCFNNITCIRMPIDLTDLIYGNVIKTQDIVSCEGDYTIFSDNNSFFKKKVFVKDGKIEKLEIYDYKTSSPLTVKFGEKSKEGYYKNLILKLDNIKIDMNITDIKTV